MQLCAEIRPYLYKGTLRSDDMSRDMVFLVVVRIALYQSTMIAYLMLGNEDMTSSVLSNNCFKSALLYSDVY